MKVHRTVYIISLLAATLPVGAQLAPTSRYGPFGQLDHRSIYGQGWFPEPLRVDESDVDNELRVDWQHDQRDGAVSNNIKSELEKSFGLTTLEFEVPYSISTAKAFDPGTGRALHEQVQGFGNISLGARRPFFEYVSDNDVFDTTLGGAIEVGIPTNSPVSKNAEIVPKVFNDLRLGHHFSLQAVLGLSYVFGPAPDGGTRTFEYGLVFGYSIDHDDLPLPHVQRLIPMAELVGHSGLDRRTAGTSNLTSTLGFRINLDPIGPFQPRLGAGYILPIDKGARQELNDGFIISIVAEY